MSTIAITVTVLLALVMGSVGGVTTLASQSMPGSPIYTMKLFMEETTLFMAPDPETRAEQHLLMFQERSREVQQLALSGEIPDEALINRLELHLRQTLHFARSDGTRTPGAVPAACTDRASGAEPGDDAAGRRGGRANSS